MSRSSPSSRSSAAAPNAVAAESRSFSVAAASSDDGLPAISLSDEAHVPDGPLYNPWAYPALLLSEDNGLKARLGFYPKRLFTPRSNAALAIRDSKAAASPATVPPPSPTATSSGAVAASDKAAAGSAARGSRGAKPVIRLTREEGASEAPAQGGGHSPAAQGQPARSKHQQQKEQQLQRIHDVKKQQAPRVREPHLLQPQPPRPAEQQRQATAEGSRVEAPPAIEKLQAVDAPVSPVPQAAGGRAPRVVIDKAMLSEAQSEGEAESVDEAEVSFAVTSAVASLAERTKPGRELMSAEEARRMAARLLVFGFDGTVVTRHARRMVEMGAGGVILFSRNFSAPQQLARLCLSLKRLAAPRPLLTLVDQEGGRVARLGAPFTRVPPARTIGYTDDPAMAQAVGRVMAKELRAAGIDVNLAPVVDVDSNPSNPVIGDRSFGGSPASVGALGAALIRGLQREGVGACAKHFPGHGDTSVDSHVELPFSAASLQRLQQVELPPFQQAVNADVAAIMVAHIDVPALEGDRSGSGSEAEAGSGVRGKSSALSARGDGSKRPVKSAVEVAPAGSQTLRRPVLALQDAQRLTIQAAEGSVSIGDTPFSPSSTLPHTPFPPPQPGAPHPLPASLSPSAISYLRETMHFEGAVLTDCLEMGGIVRNFSVPEAAVRATVAGADMFLICHTEARQVAAVDSVARAILSGRVPEERLRSAHRAIDALAATYCEAAPAGDPAPLHSGGEDGSAEEEGFWAERLAVVGCLEHSRVVEEVEVQAARSWARVLAQQRAELARRQAAAAEGVRGKAEALAEKGPSLVMIALGLISCAVLITRFRV